MPYALFAVVADVPAAACQWHPDAAASPTDSPCVWRVDGPDGYIGCVATSPVTPGDVAKVAYEIAESIPGRVPLVWRIVGVPPELLEVEDAPDPVDLASIEAPTAALAIAAYEAQALLESEDDPDGYPPPEVTSARRWTAEELDRAAGMAGLAGLVREAREGWAREGLSVMDGSVLPRGGDSAGYLDED